MRIASPPSDATPPGEVSDLTIIAGDHKATLSYVPPPDADFSVVEITRLAPRDAQRRFSGTLVYRGRAERIVDEPLQNGIQYRYVIVAIDRGGNRSDGLMVTIRPKSKRLVAPADGSKVRANAPFVWRAVAGATYYNFQLFRGDKKVLSIWPGRNGVVLPKHWTFNGRRYMLAAGSYRWYVWPGYGARKTRKYGSILGWAAFTVG